MEQPNCKNCSYRIVLAIMFDIHIDHLDCEKYGTEECKKLQEEKEYDKPKKRKR